MDPFLFASVGEEIAGIPLSVLSALAQLDLDPRNEAARLSNLTREAAASQLGRLFARLPDRPWTSSEIRRIASTLVELLPTPQNGGEKQSDHKPQNQPYCVGASDLFGPGAVGGFSVPNSAGLRRLGQSRPCFAGIAGQLLVPVQPNTLIRSPGF